MPEEASEVPAAKVGEFYGVAVAELYRHSIRGVTCQGQLLGSWGPSLLVSATPMEATGGPKDIRLYVTRTQFPNQQISRESMIVAVARTVPSIQELTKATLPDLPGLERL